MARLSRWVVVVALARAEVLRMEITVDGAVEALEFDRCDGELALIAKAHAFVHRSGSTLHAVAQPSGPPKSHSELVVDEMTRLQAQATFHSRDGPCVVPAAPPDALPPVWNWGDARNVARKLGGPKLKLNFGGGVANDFHGFDDRYEGWVGVEGPSDPDGFDYGFCSDPAAESCGKPWCLCADLTTGSLPVDAGTVDAILTEHTLEHIKFEHWPRVLAEFHRALRVGGLLRVAVPDYHAPDADARAVFHDPAAAAEHRRVHGHHAFTSKAAMAPLLAASPFAAVYWLHYYDGPSDRPPDMDDDLPFVRNPVDYGLGFVKRTRDHPPGVSENVTSVVVDLVKLA